ncbi:MAG: aminotransferase class I/II-fold pyridoxal phosphate-dependent enzyme [Elusimicrobia bacterium]|nr:MAG: aminotransferase class I/II-fold pyridoxal phosphate-dependent enzyme [Elusimicrobiota bacterium]
MHYVRMPIEIESPEQLGYDRVRYNLTESSLTDARLQDLWSDLGPDMGPDMGPDLGLDQALRELVLCYSDHRGHPDLRALIAQQSQPESASRVLSPDHVLVTAGAALALFIVSTTLLERGDHLIVVRPNYATNIETPRALGADITYLDLRFEDGWRLDVDGLRQALRPNTRLVSLTTPHNPTGTLLSQADLRRVLALLEGHGAYLLVDETYREMAFGEVPPVAAALSPRAISVSSMSKTFGLPGIRIGWLLCRDAGLSERFLAAKEQIIITNSVVDEAIALRYLTHKARQLSRIRRHIDQHWAIARAWLAEPSTAELIECVEPQGGVVCFPRLRDPQRHGISVDAFYRILNERYQTYVGPGHWFEQDRRYLRIGFGWPSTDDLKTGLGNITKALLDARGTA